MQSGIDISIATEIWLGE